MRKGFGGIVALAALVLTLPSMAQESTGVGAADNWTAHNAGPYETAFSRLNQITGDNITQVGLTAFLDLPGEATLEATPLAVDGVLYFTGSYATVYAVNGATGKVLWKFDPQVWKNNPKKMHFSFWVNRGAAYANGRIFAAALDGRLFALDAKTGKLAWSVETSAPDSMYTITGAPRTFKDKVIIGNGGADYGARGYVTSYDQATGKQVWRFYTVPGTPEEDKGDPVMERAASTWKGSYWKTGTGGGPWDSITFDPDFNRIYLGTANAAPYDPEARSPGGGDNLFTASIVALDADTGKYAWHYQVNPRDSWDYDCTQQMTLADLFIEGKQRKVLMQAPKNGFFYVLDRQTGKLISAEKIGKATWADRIDLKTGRPVEAKNIRYEDGPVTIWPAPIGAHVFMSMSYSPLTGYVYIPYMQLGVRLAKNQKQEGGTDAGNINIKPLTQDKMDGKGALVAWNPVRQKAAWRAPLDTIWNGGALATAGNLVFQGAGDGYISAYNAITGQRLWHFNAGMGINGAPISYTVNGKQYIAVLAGYGGSASVWTNVANAGWKYDEPRRLLIFSLDGKAILPTPRPRDTRVDAVDDPSIKINPAEVAEGHDLFLPCSICHGLNLIGTGGPGPDLRASQIALNPDSLWTVVHDGTLMENGMPQFPDLTRGQVMKIYAYIRSGARKAIAAEHEHQSSRIQGTKPASPALNSGGY